MKPHFYEVVQASGGRGPQVSQGLIITLALGFRGAPWCESALYFQPSSGSHTVSWSGESPQRGLSPQLYPQNSRTNSPRQLTHLPTSR